MSEARIAFSPGGCCCKKQIYNPCPGCHEYLNKYTNPDLPGIVLSQSPFLWPQNTDSPYTYVYFEVSNFQRWDLTPFQNIMASYPQYRCGYWRITLPCDYDLYEPHDYYTGNIYSYGSMQLAGCIDLNGNLIGLPERLYVGPAGNFIHDRIYDLFLCIAAPRVTSNRLVEPNHWPVTPGTSHSFSLGRNAINDVWDMLNYINWARTRPQDWLNNVIQRFYPDLIAYDPEITRALLRFHHPTANHLLNVWGAATPVPPLKLNPILSQVCIHHANRMIQDQEQRWFTSEEKTAAYEYLSNNYKGIADIENDCCYAYGRDDREGTRYFSAASFTGGAFLLDWGVPDDRNRNYLLNPSFTEIGIGIVRYYNSLSPLGVLVTAIIFGSR